MLILTITGEYNEQKTMIYEDSLSLISKQIKVARKQKGWSQKKLAELSGLDRTTIGALERADYSDMGIRKIQRVLELLNKNLTVIDTGLPTLEQLQTRNRSETNE